MKNKRLVVKTKHKKNRLVTTHTYNKCNKKKRLVTTTIKRLVTTRTQQQKKREKKRK